MRNNIRFFSEKIKPAEFFILFSVFLSFAFFIHLTSILLPKGVSEAEENYIYLLSFGLCPIIVYLINKLTKSDGDGDGDEVSPANQLLLFSNGYLVVVFSVYHLSLALTTKRYSPVYIYAFSGAQILLTTIFLLIGSWKPKVVNFLYNPLIEIGNKILIIVSPLVLFVLFMTDYQQEIIGALSSNLNFQIGFLIGFLVSICIIIFSKLSLPKFLYYKKSSKIISIFLFFGVVLLIFSLFDPSLSYDPHHYNSYIGPAMAIRGGWIPFVDIHNHYGLLPFLLVVWLFNFVSPSYKAMAFLISFSNVLQALVLFLILHKILKNKLLLYLGGTLAILFYKISVAFNSNAFPSTGAFRHLPTLLLFLALLYLPKGKKFSVFTLASLLLCSFWSFDQFLYGFIIYLAFMIGNDLVANKQFLSKVKYIFMLLAIPLFAHGVFSLFMFIHYGVLPRYDLYFETLKQIEVGNWWEYPVNINKLIFGFHLILYSTVIVYSIKVVFSKDQSIRQHKWDFVKYIFIAAIMGIFHMQYFVGRSSEIALMYYSLPLGIVMLGLIDSALEVKKYYFVKILCYILIVVVFSLSTGATTEKFVIPGGFSYSSTKGFAFEGNSSSYKETHTVLRKYLQIGVTLNSILKDLKKEFFQPPVCRSIGTNPDELEEAIALIRKWQPKEKKILLFLTGDLGVAALVYTDKAYKYPIGFATLDSLFPKKIAKILSTPVKLKEGDILITNCVGATSTPFSFQDNGITDKTKDWNQEGDYLTFDSDKYEFATSVNNKHFYHTDMKFAKEKWYKISIDIKDGTAESKDFNIYVCDGATNIYSPLVTTTSTWTTHSLVIKSGATTTDGYVGIRILSSLGGKNIEVKNFTVSEIVVESKIAQTESSDWCSTGGLGPIEKEILENIISLWDCNLVEESVSGVKVYKLKSKT